jgi:predicted DNA binding CopG/RHH family protein
MKHKNIKEAMKTAKATGKPQRLAAQDMSDIKINIGIRLDLNVLSGIKAEAEKKALPYQTLINSILKQHLDAPDLIARIEALERSNKAG